MCSQVLPNATFGHLISRNHYVNTLHMADATSQNSCCFNVTTILYKKPIVLFSLSIGRNLPILFIPSVVYLNICKLLIFLHMRLSCNEFTSKFCLVPRRVPPSQTVNECQYTSLHLLPCAITHTLHYTIILFLKQAKSFLYINHTRWCNNHNIFQYFSHNQNALYEKFYHVAKFRS